MVRAAQQQLADLFVLLGVGLIILTVLVGCAPRLGSQSSSVIAKNRVGNIIPLIVVIQKSGFDIDSPDFIELAAWSNGLVLIGTSYGMGDVVYETGCVDASYVQKAFALLRNENVINFEGDTVYVAMDAPQKIIYVRSGSDSRVFIWDGNFWPYRVDTERGRLAFLDFLKRWIVLNFAVGFLDVTDSEFRSITSQSFLDEEHQELLFDPSDPFASDWLAPVLTDTP